LKFVTKYEPLYGTYSKISEEVKDYLVEKYHIKLDKDKTGFFEYKNIKMKLYYETLHGKSGFRVKTVE